MNAVIATVVTALVIKDEDKKKRPRSCWVNPYLAERLKKGRFSTDLRYTTRIDYIINIFFHSLKI